MTRRLLFLMVALLLFAAPSAEAVNEGKWPQTLIDINCTDTEDTPAPATGSVRPAVQTSGSLDNFCDHDSRIQTGPLTSDEVFGPFRLKQTDVGIVVWVDADVVSNDTDTWRIAIIFKKPHDNTDFVSKNGITRSTEGSSFAESFSPSSVSIGATVTNVNIPRVFYIKLDVITATSWDGSISWVAF